MDRPWFRQSLLHTITQAVEFKDKGRPALVAAGATPCGFNKWFRLRRCLLCWRVFRRTLGSGKVYRSFRREEQLFVRSRV